MPMPDAVFANLPIVLVPGLNCSARLYAEQIPALWRFGPVTVADHTRDDSIAAIASRILAAAPPVFALAGLSMGGYIAFEIMRQAPQRVAKLALLDTGARAETAEQTQRRQAPMEMARTGALRKSPRTHSSSLCIPTVMAMSHSKHLVQTMADETGVEAYLRQQRAIMRRPEFAAEPRGDRVSDLGARRRTGQRDASRARARDGRRNSRFAPRRCSRLRPPLDHRAAGSRDPSAGRMDAGVTRPAANIATPQRRLALPISAL